MPKGRLKTLGWPWRFVSRSTASTVTKPKKARPPKPPHGFPNDGEYAHLKSLNILYDPGFELFMANAVEHWGNDEWVARTGSNQFTLPLYDTSCEYGQQWPSGNCVEYWDIAQWAQVSGPYEPEGSVDKSAWQVTRYDPYLGDFHLVWSKWNSTAAYGGDGNPRPLMIQSPGLPPGYSARVKAGDMNSWSIRAMLGGARSYWVTPNVTMSLYYYTDTGSAIVGVTGISTMDVTGPYEYKEHRIDAIAPNGAYFIRAMAQFHTTSSWGYFIPSVYVDSGVLSVW